MVGWWNGRLKRSRKSRSDRDRQTDMELLNAPSDLLLFPVFSQRFVVTEPQWVNPRQDWTLGHIHCYCVANNGEGGTIGQEEQVPCPRVLLRATTRKNPQVDRQPPERIGDPVLIKEALTRIVRSKLRPSSRPSWTWRRNAGTDLEMSLNWPSAIATVSRNEARKSPVWFVTWGNR